jgi:hypothetical protein
MQQSRRRAQQVLLHRQPGLLGPSEVQVDCKEMSDEPVCKTTPSGFLLASGGWACSVASHTRVGYMTSITAKLGGAMDDAAGAQ